MCSDPLQVLLEQGRLPHALLLIDATQRACRFAQQLVGTQLTHHPDIHHFYPEGKSGLHPIHMVRTLIDQVNLSSLQAPYKVFLIHEAERMSPTSANALLKVFEEPSPHTILMLLTHHREAILPTVASRCQLFDYHESHNAFKALDALFASMAGPSMAGPSHAGSSLSGEERFQEIEQAIEGDCEQMVSLLDTTLRIARDVWLLHEGLPTHLLFFPARIAELHNIPLRPLLQFEQRLRQARLGFERQVKPTTVLRHLFHKSAISMMR